MTNGLRRFLSMSEINFYNERERVLDGVSAIDVAESPMLFHTRQQLSDTVARIELFEMIQSVPGFIVECGVNTGNNLLLMALLSCLKEPYAINRKVIGFDTFAGFSSIDNDRDPGARSNHFAASNLSRLESSMRLFDMNRPLSHIPKIQLVVGDAVETIPIWVRNTPEAVISMLYLDFDLYHPTKTALEALLPLVAKGGIVAFDQFAYEKFPGETSAFWDVIGDKLELKKLSYHPFIAYSKK
jgi:hypothetical protein